MGAEGAGAERVEVEANGAPPPRPLLFPSPARGRDTADLGTKVRRLVVGGPVGLERVSSNICNTLPQNSMGSGRNKSFPASCEGFVSVLDD